MNLIKKRKGWQKGKHGITIQVFSQKEKMFTKTMTLHGLTPSQIIEDLKFYFKAKKLSEKQDVTLVLRSGKNGKKAKESKEKTTNHRR